MRSAEEALQKDVIKERKKHNGMHSTCDTIAGDNRSRSTYRMLSRSINVTA